MTTQYSPILKLALPVQGELSGTWGEVVNDNITSMVEQAIAGRVVINTWTTNSHTLTTANGTTSESRCAMLELTDTGTALSGAGTVICPTASKIYIVKNASGQNITVKTASGTGILVPNGRTTFLFCDGTNVVEAMTHTTSLQLGTSTTVTAVLDEDNMASDSPTSLATQQSIKAYVDAQVGAFDSLAEVLAVGNTTGSNDIIVTAGQKITVDTIDETTAAAGVTIDSVLLKDDGINATDLEVTNIKANDGTAAATIADSTGVVTVPSAVLTTADINGGTADGVVLGGTTPAAATATTLTANTNLTIAGTVTVTSILDEDNMSSDDPAGLATQQSIKAYVDAQVGTADELSEVLANGNTTGGNNILFGDNDKAIFGAGSDLQIYHDGNHSRIKDLGTGSLVIGADEFIVQNAAGTENKLIATTDGAVSMSYNGGTKLATTATGIDVTGTVLADGLTIEKNQTTAYNGSATDGQLSAGATAFVQQTGGSNNALSQIVFQPRSGFGYNRIVNSGGSAPYMALTTNNAEAMRIDASGNVIIANSGGTLQTATAAGDASNLCLGANAGNSIAAVGGTAAGNLNVLVGNNAGTALTTGYRNTLLGAFAGDALNTGHNNVAIGLNALTLDTSGYRNIAIGSAALNLQNAGYHNIAIGFNALTSNLTGNTNVAVGAYALNFNTASNNTALGETASYKNTSGSQNVAVGYRASYLNQTSGLNTAVGYQALYNNIANYNTAFGHQAGKAITSGTENLALGRASMRDSAGVTGNSNTGLGNFTLNSLTSGDSNVAIGPAALNNVDSGDQNIAIGNNAGTLISSASNNVAIGHQALASSTTGNGLNVAIGYQTLNAQTTGSLSVGVGAFALHANTYSGNVAVGYAALEENVAGAANIAVGFKTLENNVSGNYNVGMGFTALQDTTGSNNVAIGHQAMLENQGGGTNIAIGANALYQNSSGNANVAIGSGEGGVSVGALGGNTTGTKNTAVGALSLITNGSGIENTAIGYQALTAADSNYNTAIGAKAGVTNSTGNITAIGSYTLYANTTGTRNVAVGGADGSGASMGTNQTGNDNVAVGYHSLQTNVSGGVNVALGSYALYNNVTNSNVGIGYQSGYTTSSGTQNTLVGTYAGFANTTASGNTYLGNQAGYASLGGYNTFLGHDTGRYTLSTNYNTYVGRFDGVESYLDVRAENNIALVATGNGEVAFWFDGDSSGNSDPLHAGGALGYAPGFVNNAATPSTAGVGSYGMFHSGSDNDSNVRLRIANRVDTGGTLEYPVQLHLIAGRCDSSGTTNKTAWYLYGWTVDYASGSPLIRSGPNLVDSGGDTSSFSISASDGGDLNSGNAVQVDFQVASSGAAEIFYNAWVGGRTWTTRMWRISS